MTVGWVLAFGALPGPLQVVPGAHGLWPSIGLFLAGTAVLCLVSYAIAAWRYGAELSRRV